MKIRTGFVSNSSSSSFTCDFCGEEYSGWDASLDDAQMTSCKHGHTICKDHLTVVEKNKDYVIKKLAANNITTVKLNDDMDTTYEGVTDENYQEVLETLDEYLMDIVGEDNVLEEECSLCQFAGITDHTLVRYFLHIHGVTKDDILKEIKNKFKTYTELEEFLAKDITNED